MGARRTPRGWRICWPGWALRKSVGLSGGQQQRVAIGRALLTRPALLLADEPTGNLDSAAGKNVADLLEQIHLTTGQTVVMITHDETLALRAQRILRLKDGRIVKDEVIRP